MRAQIFLCHYKPPVIPLRSPLFSYLVSGYATPEDGSFIGDLDGVNIASDNTYTELRHHYYIWKNRLGQLDFVGVEHYRRMLFLDFLPAEKLSRLAPHLLHVRSWAQVDRALALVELERHQLEQAIAMRQHASDEDLVALLRWLGNRDIILPRMWPLHDRPDLEGQWRASGAPPEMWEDMMAAFGAQAAMRPVPTTPIRTACFNNCFMMRSELFDKYMTALFQAIEQLKDRLTGRPYYPFHRMWGYVGERALNYFVHAEVAKNALLDVTQLPMLLRSAPDEL